MVSVKNKMHPHGGIEKLKQKLLVSSEKVKLWIPPTAYGQWLVANKWNTVPTFQNILNSRRCPRTWRESSKAILRSNRLKLLCAYLFQNIYYLSHDNFSFKISQLWYTYKIQYKMALVNRFFYRLKMLNIGYWFELS